MFNTPKMKLPEKHTEVFKTYKNGTPEEKAEIEGCFIKTVKDEDSEFYSPMLASLNEQQLKSMLRQVLFLIQEMTMMIKNLKIWIGSISLLLEYCDYSA